MGEEEEASAGGGTKTWSQWIQVDGSGNAGLVEIGNKYDIMHRLHNQNHDIDARDLRILDPLLSYPSTILCRHNAILLNLEHIKAIITARQVFVQDPTDENVIPVVEELQRRLPPIHDGTEAADSYQQDMEWSSPFEFRALEVILEAVCSFLAARTTELELATYPALDLLTSKISNFNLERVRKLKSAMTRLTARVQKVRDEVEQLMDDDEDMADLYLSRKLASSTVGLGASPPSTVLEHQYDVEELELLLEAYFMQIDDTLNKLTTNNISRIISYVLSQLHLQLRGYIDDTEDYINIQIDNHRNQLIQLDVFLKTGEISLSFYSLVAAIFGMSIPYTWNHDHGYLFKWVVTFSGAVSALIFLGIIGYARKKGVVGR